ncbi:MAG: energy transducer TonB [Sciscionella sp.]
MGEGNVGLAVQVRFMIDNGRAESMKLWVARTRKGETISGPAIENYILSQPPPFSFSGGAGYGLTNKYGSRSGVFHLTVRPDGSVAEVTAAKSFGNDKMNLEAADWLKKWKFRPNSLTEVQVPMVFHWSAY